MVILILGLTALAVLVFVGRYARNLRLNPKLVPAAFALLAAVAAVAAVAASLRGAWIVSVVLIGLSAWLGRTVGRMPGPGAAASRTMPDSEARSILGVGAEAGAAEIEAAYRRLMLRTHPDHGGSSGLAAQLNAARDSLIKKK
jgi:hypothetical protein